MGDLKMENSIFENAKFGDVFKTKNITKAIYANSIDDVHWLLLEGSRDTYAYYSDGKLVSDPDSDKNIVARWGELEGEGELPEEVIENLKDELDALNMRYLSQVSLWKSRCNVLIDEACAYLRSHVDERVVVCNNNKWCSLDEFIKKFRKSMGTGSCSDGIAEWSKVYKDFMSEMESCCKSQNKTL